MRYALNLAEDNHILSATYDKYAAPLDPIVEELPDGDITDYRYENAEYIYDPLPRPEPPEQESEWDILNALLGVE